MTQTEYRKKKGSDSWHWHKNCAKWPGLNYDRKFTKPTVGELCSECKLNGENKVIKP
jgi:hypothetical protein